MDETGLRRVLALALVVGVWGIWWGRPRPGPQPRHQILAQGKLHLDQDMDEASATARGLGYGFDGSFDDGQRFGDIRESILFLGHNKLNKLDEIRGSLSILRIGPLQLHKGQKRSAVIQELQRLRLDIQEDTYSIVVPQECLRLDFDREKQTLYYFDLSIRR